MAGILGQLLGVLAVGMVRRIAEPIFVLLAVGRSNVGSMGTRPGAP